jgi:hypothetical protein
MAKVPSKPSGELAAAFMNAKEAAYIRNVLQVFGYQQQKTPIVTDNSFVFSIVKADMQSETISGHGHAIPLVAGSCESRAV